LYNSCHAAWFYTPKKLSATHVIKLGFAPNSYPPGQYVIPVTTTLVIHLSPVSTTPAMKLLNKYQPAYTLNERVYCKPIASQQKTFCLKIFLIYRWGL
jgi:hypothetical protein